MEYVRLGRTGLKVSRICLGMMTYGDPAWRPWVLPSQEGLPFVRRALELGINFFDTADMYSRGVSEEFTGRALATFARRDQVVVATKLFYPVEEGPNAQGLSRYHVFSAIDASLRRLKMDYVDLYQIHRWDPDTPIEETLQALEDLIRMGKVRYIGASSMFAWQFAKALYTSDLRGWSRFVSMQNHYNLIYREEEREMLPLCAAEGIGTIPWSPLARGFLSGTRGPGSRGETPRARTDTIAHGYYYGPVDFAIAERAAAVARERGSTPAKVALAWLLGRPTVVAPIVGASKMSHLEDAVAAVGIQLSPQECAQLEELYVPHTVSGHE